MACWRGSGYELRRVRETVLDGHPAYVGELHKKGSVLYTAWWFSNGAITTISQLTMRTQMLRGEAGFVLVNVTTDRKNAPFRFGESVYKKPASQRYSGVISKTILNFIFLVQPDHQAFSFTLSTTLYV